jgi:hypothetical protein
MRLTTPLMIAAAALAAASPAAAQNAAAPTDNTASNAVNAVDVSANGTVETTTATDPAAAAAQTNAVPVDNTAAADAAAGQPAPEEKHGFPWGILGLLGLLGFIPRARRRS